MVTTGDNVTDPVFVEGYDITRDDLIQLCRLCGNSSNQLMPIFTGDGVEHNLPDKIREHIPIIDVVEDDLLPPNVCYQCASTLISWHELYYVCKDADIRIRQIREKLIEKEKKLEPPSYDVEDDFIDSSVIDADHETNGVHVESNDADTESETVLLSPFRLPAAPLSSSFNEIEENDVTEPPSTPVIEINRCSSATDATNNQSLSYLVNSVDEPAFLIFNSKCSVCYVDINNNGKYLNGVLLCTRCYQRQCRLTYKQDFLQVVALTEGDAIIDPKLIHGLGEEKTYVKCDRCFVLCEANEFDTHWANHVIDAQGPETKTENNWRCSLCSRVFQQKNGLVLHMKNHNRPPHKCKVCDKIFKTKILLQKHAKRHVGTRIKNSTLIFCEVCKKYFKTKKGFAYHQQKICVQYKCYVCDETFLVNSVLQDHLKTKHDDEQRKTLLDTTTTVKAADNETVMSVCPVCGKVVTQAVLPRHMVLHNEERPFTCDGCGKQFKRKHALQDHIMIEMGMKNYVCDVCGMKFLKQGYLNKHVRYHKLSNGEFQGFPCEQCDKKFSEKWRLGVHQRAVHKGGKFSSCKCDICDKLFAERWMVKLHKHKEHNGEEFKEYSCDVCGRKFLEKWMMQSHLRTTHRSGMKKTYCELCGRSDHESSDCRHRHSNQNVQCLLCSETFPSNLTLKKHVTSVHGFVDKKQYKKRLSTADDGKTVLHLCPGCDQHFYSKEELVQHETKENCFKPLKYQCSECGKSYMNKFSLRNHMLSHDKMKADYAFHCEFCEKRFAATEGLANHLSLNKICLLCDKAYPCNNRLKSHVFDDHGDDDDENIVSVGGPKSETDTVKEEKCYKCRLCGKLFDRRQAMKNHLFAEMNLRRFVCEFCDKSYNYYSHMKEHIITNHGEKEFLCVYCGKDFPTRKRYRDHVTLHSEEKPFQCTCGVSFKLLRYLSKHKKQCKILQDEAEKKYIEERVG